MPVNTAAGISFTHTGVGATDGIAYYGTSAVWFDYDRDNDQDLFLTTRSGPNVLYENQGNGTFTDVSAAVQLNVSGDAGGASAADYDNDGWLDLYVTYADTCDVLYKNMGGLYFQDVTRAAELDTTEIYRGTSASWGDYDGDGYLDFDISNHIQLGHAGIWIYFSQQDDMMYHNDGDGTFTEVSHLLGPHLKGAGYIAGWTDYDNDGDADILLINDCLVGSGAGLIEPTKLFRNDGGTNPLTWNFTEVSALVGANHCQNGMGLAVGDYNRDGWLDYYYTNIGRCMMLKNNHGTFTDVADSTLTGSQVSTIYTWGTSFLDFDLDGWLDIYVAAGALDVPPFSQPDYFFRHNGPSLTFTNIASALGLADPRMSRTGVTSDYDKDGDLDLFVVSYDDTCTLYRNDFSTGRHYLIVDLEGVASNRDGIGSRLKVTTPDGVSQYFETRSGSNLGGGDDLGAHFGLDTNTVVSEIEIKWPSGIVQRLTNTPADQRILATEPVPVLPIELASFEVKALDCQVAIDWTTASEQNSSHFVVERSIDGLNFHAINEIAAVGESNELRTYGMIDHEPFADISF